MTVKELVEQLNKYEPNLQVYSSSCEQGEGWEPVKKLDLNVWSVTNSSGVESNFVGLLIRS